MTDPLVTIGVVSCNRLHYLKAMIESARECIKYDNLEWIIVDNASIEPGLREYIESLDFVKHKIFRPERSPSTEHIEAMNLIVEMSNADYLMILPEDVQFIVKGRWMNDFVEVLSENGHLGNICINAQRRMTLDRFFGPERRFVFFTRPRDNSIYRTRSGVEFLGYGDSKPGILGAGILSFSRTEVWRKLGPWKSTGSQTVADSSGGGETEILQRLESSGMKLERCLPKIPVAVEIITDNVGSKARIRGNRRYGAYWEPPSGHYYYRDNFCCDSGAITMVKLINLLSAEGKPLAELIRPLKRYHTTGEVNFEVADKDGMITMNQPLPVGAGHVLGGIDGDHPRQPQGRFLVDGEQSGMGLLAAHDLLGPLAHLAVQIVANRLEAGRHVVHGRGQLRHLVAGLQRDADRKSTRLNSSHTDISRMPSSA